jgi:catechol 2,3-dioxygenase-like lactoylglutathione lyase family enzyme
VSRFLHTMVRITDPEKSKAFYEALGFRCDRDVDIVRDGQVGATNYFFSLGDDESTTWRPRWHAWPSRGSSPSAHRTRYARAVRGSVSSAIRTVSFEH